MCEGHDEGRNKCISEMTQVAWKGSNPGLIPGDRAERDANWTVELWSRNEKIRGREMMHRPIALVRAKIEFFHRIYEFSNDEALNIDNWDS